MSDDKSTQSGDKDVQSDEDDDFTPQKSEKEYARMWRETSAEAKKYRLKNQDLQAKLEQFEQEKMQSEGKKDELIQKLKKQVDEFKNGLQDKTRKYADRMIKSQLKAEAAKAGCIDPDALIQIANLESLEVSDDFDVSEDSVKGLLKDMQKAKPYLFQKEQPSIKDGSPNPKGGGKTVDKPIAKMTIEERKEVLLKSRA